MVAKCQPYDIAKNVMLSPMSLQNISIFSFKSHRSRQAQLKQKQPRQLSMVFSRPLPFVVKLEMGARGDPYPTEEKIIGPYAAYDYPTFFEEADTKVIVLSMRRTFWEKATILHAEAHRPADKQTPQNYSRHYYDLAMLLDTSEGKIAAEDFAMLAQVAKHKTVFFRSGWASYHTAKSGTLKLVPDEKRIKTLRLDYNKMQSMIFDQPVPSFDAIIKKLRKLEETINGSNLA